jgi:hypothetical protein
VLSCGRQIGCRKDDHGTNAHLTRKDEKAFKTRYVEVLIAGRDDEERVAVRGDELDPAVVAWVRPLEQARAIENAHEASAVPPDQQPVADSGSVDPSPSFRNAGRNRVLELFGRDVHSAAMNRHDADGPAVAGLLAH